MLHWVESNVILILMEEKLECLYVNYKDLLVR